MSACTVGTTLLLFTVGAGFSHYSFSACPYDVTLSASMSAISFSSGTIFATYGVSTSITIFSDPGGMVGSVFGCSNYLFSGSLDLWAGPPRHQGGFATLRLPKVSAVRASVGQRLMAI